MTTLVSAQGKLSHLSAIREYVTAGRARFTLVSKRTGTRKTFRVKTNGEGAWFVELLTGPDNASDYAYLCFLYPSRWSSQLCLKHNRDNWGPEAFAAFYWLVDRLNEAAATGEEDEAERRQLYDAFDRQAEFWHLGTCGRCGRDLTDPESIVRGLGPTCAGRE